MPPNPTGISQETAAREGAALIRGAIESDADELCRSIAAKIRRASRDLRREEVAELAIEVMGEAVGRALARPEKLDPGRSAYGWLMGISIRILMERNRDAACNRRQITGTDLGEGAWGALLGHLSSGPSDAATADRIDLDEALGRLDPTSRFILECRFFRGLDGEELAEALGATSEGAARVRVSRALQRLRALIVRAEPEVTS